MKLKTILLTALCLACTFPASADFTNGNFAFREDGDSCTLTVYYGGPGKVIIPSTATKTEYGVTIEYPVKSIGYRAFYGNSGITSVTIPDPVRIIGEGAFYGCYSLDSVTMPNSVTTIGPSAFEGCYSLDSVKMSNSVTTIGPSAFNGCVSLKTLTIPNTVTSIEYRAFGGCISLYSMTISNSILTIESNLFAGCTGLTSVTIPNSVITIKDNAFDGCISLDSLTIPNSVTSIGSGAFKGCVALKDVFVSWPLPKFIPVLGGGLFESVNLANSTLHVPADTKWRYEEVDTWKAFGTILESVAGGEGEPDPDPDPDPANSDAIETLDSPRTEVSYSDNILTVTSPSAEQVEIYSITGARVYKADKIPGTATYNINHLPKSPLIIRGSSGWTQKIIFK
jgi:hypothetical protein